jgi:hypothetical protein
VSVSNASIIATATDYVTVGTTRILQTLTNCSVAIRFKVNGNGGANGPTLYNERSATGNDLWKITTNDATNSGYKFTHRNSAGTLDECTVSVSLADGLWHQLVLTKAGTSVRLYLDGALGVGSPFTLVGDDVLTDASPKATIGNDNADAAASNFNGPIDEVILFNAALSATQVSNLYFGGGLPPSILSWFLLDEGTGTTTKDSFGTNTGTLSSSTIWSADVSKLPYKTILKSTRPHAFSPGLAR